MKKTGVKPREKTREKMLKKRAKIFLKKRGWPIDNRLAFVYIL